MTGDGTMMGLSGIGGDPGCSVYAMVLGGRGEGTGSPLRSTDKSLLLPSHTHSLFYTDLAEVAGRRAPRPPIAHEVRGSYGVTGKQESFCHEALCWLGDGEDNRLMQDSPDVSCI